MADVGDWRSFLRRHFPFATAVLLNDRHAVSFRFFRLTLIAVALVASGVNAHAQLDIVRVFTGWRDAASFKRISEYFTGRENPGRQLIHRSTPAERDGYYFLIRLKNEGAPFDAKFVFQVISSNSSAPKEFSFVSLIPGKASVFNLGLTGPHWPDKDTHAIAWKLDIMDASGRVVATDQSYLWEKPE